MKTKPFTILTAGIAAMLAAPAFAIEAPADDAPPPRAVPPQPAQEAPSFKHPTPASDAQRPPTPPPASDTAAPDTTKPDAKADAKPEAKPEAKADAKVQPAFLGVVSTELPAMLAEHLGLKDGEGIVVRALNPPDGPAAKAGVAVHDVITRIGDQPVTSAADFSKQVASRKAGDKIHLDLIHQGKAVGLDVTLGARPDDVAAIDPLPLDHLNLQGVPKDLADRVRRAIEGNGINMNFEEGVLEIAPKLEAEMREMRKRMNKAMQNLNAPGAPDAPRIDIQQGASIRLMDDQGSIELKSSDGGKEVTIRDKDNKIAWNGPWDTDQDKAAAPDDIRKRVERLNLDSKFQGHGLRLHFGGAIPLTPAPPKEDQ